MEVLKFNDYSKEKDDSGTNPNLLSLLSSNNKDARSGTIFHLSSDTRAEAAWNRHSRSVALMWLF